jgi:hypothetical protein
VLISNQPSGFQASFQTLCVRRRCGRCSQLGRAWSRDQGCDGRSTALGTSSCLLDSFVIFCLGSLYIYMSLNRCPPSTSFSFCPPLSLPSRFSIFALGCLFSSLVIPLGRSHFLSVVFAPSWTCLDNYNEPGQGRKLHLRINPNDGKGLGFSDADTNRDDTILAAQPTLPTGTFFRARALPGKSTFYFESSGTTSKTWVNFRAIRDNPDLKKRDGTSTLYNGAFLGRMMS